MLLYTDGKFNASKYVNVLDTINNIKESKTKTRKEFVSKKRVIKDYSILFFIFVNLDFNLAALFL